MTELCCATVITAGREGCNKCIEAHIDKDGIECVQRGGSYTTAFNTAIYHEQTHSALLMLVKGADPSLKPLGCYPLASAYRSGNVETMKLLFAASPQKTRMSSGCQRDLWTNHIATRFMHSIQRDSIDKVIDGMTSFGHNILDHSQCIELLWSLGARTIDTRTKDFCGKFVAPAVSATDDPTLRLVRLGARAMTTNNNQRRKPLFGYSRFLTGHIVDREATQPRIKHRRAVHFRESVADRLYMLVKLAESYDERRRGTPVLDEIMTLSALLDMPRFQK